MRRGGKETVVIEDRVCLVVADGQKGLRGRGVEDEGPTGRAERMARGNSSTIVSFTFPSSWTLCLLPHLPPHSFTSSSILSFFCLGVVGVVGELGNGCCFLGHLSFLSLLLGFLSWVWDQDKNTNKKKKKEDDVVSCLVYCWRMAL